MLLITVISNVVSQISRAFFGMSSIEGCDSTKMKRKSARDINQIMV